MGLVVQIRPRRYIYIYKLISFLKTKRGDKMASAEVIVLNILKIIFVIVATHIGLTKLVPMLEQVLGMSISDKKALDGLTSLLSILVLVLAGKTIVDLAKLTEIQILSYLDIFTPALELLFKLVPYFAWVLAGLVVILGIKGLSKK